MPMHRWERRRALSLLTQVLSHQRLKTFLRSQSTLPKPRLDYNRLLSDPRFTTLNHQLRSSPLPSNHLSLLTHSRNSQINLETLLNSARANHRVLSSRIKSSTDASTRSKLISEAKSSKSQIAQLESNLDQVSNQTLDLALSLPNFSHPSCPIGPESNAVILETFGPPPIPADPARDHLRIAESFGWVDNAASARAIGSSWVYLKGELACLEQALVSHATHLAVMKGYEPVAPPDVIRTDIAWRCGFQPRDSTDRNGPQQTYFIQNRDVVNSNSSNEGENIITPSTLCLAGTAEIPLSALFADQILPAHSLPRRVVGIGRAFRAEAGARGSDTRGLYRIHQFTKVELFAVTSEGSSEVMLEEIRELQKEIAQSLGLTVRVLDMPTEELGASANRKYDMEAWMPGRGKWGEITSTSNCTDYQSRRLHIRHRPLSISNSSSSLSSSSTSMSPETEHTDGGVSTTLPFAHTLNGTAAAIPRLIVALLENGVRLGKGGEIEGVNLPKCLERWWTGPNNGKIQWM